jgi:hypothetical protein
MSLGDTEGEPTSVQVRTFCAMQTRDKGSSRRDRDGTRTLAMTGTIGKGTMRKRHNLAQLLERARARIKDAEEDPHLQAMAAAVRHHMCTWHARTLCQSAALCVGQGTEQLPGASDPSISFASMCTCHVLQCIRQLDLFGPQMTHMVLASLLPTQHLHQAAASS